MSKSPGILSTAAALKDLVTVANETCQSSKKRKVIFSNFLLATDYLSTVIASIPPKERGFSTSKKKLKVVSNTLNGIIDGFDKYDLTLKEVRSISKDLLENKLPTFMTAVSEDCAVIQNKTLKPSIEKEDTILEKLKIALNEDTSKVKTTISYSNSFKKAIEKAVSDIKEGSSERLARPETTNDDSSQDATKSYLLNLKNYRSTLPATAGKSGFHVLRLPLIPVFVPVDRRLGTGSGRPSAIKAQPDPSYILKQAGIKSTKLEEYVILDNQLILCISKSNLPEKEFIAKKRTKTISLEPLDYAKLILSTIEDTTHKSYTLVDQTPTTNPRNSDLLLFWIMPTNSLSYLLKKGFPKIQKWGFPF